MRKLGVLLATVFMLVVVPSASADITSIFDGKLPCTTQPSGVRECSGPGGPDSNALANTVPSWDGTPIDINVAFPDAAEFGPGPYPMAMYFHGFGGGKESMNGDTKRFVDAGIATFSMTERGFKKSCGNKDAYDALELAVPGSCDHGFIHLMDTRYEVRDAQYFAGLLADENVIQPKKIGTVGASYGGGKSMALAALKNRIMLPDGTLAPWKSPDGKDMEIAVAAPIVPWSDFAYALVPNGRTLDYVEDSPYEAPFGVMKAGIINMLFGAGDNFSGDNNPVKPLWDIKGWKDLMSAGEPYGANPQGQVMLDEMTTHHSSYYIDDSVEPAPLIIAQGMTDDLFPVDEPLRFYNRTRANYPDAKISLLFADIGHPRAPLDSQGRPEDIEEGYQIVDTWFKHYLLGEGTEPATDVMVKSQVCPFTEPSGGPFRAANWASLAPGEMRLTDPAERVLGADAGSDAVAGGFVTLFPACTQQAKVDEPGTAEYTFPTIAGDGVTLAGSPTVVADISVANGGESQIAGRLLELTPDGKERQIARGVYRPDASGRQVIQLHGNVYKFEPGTKMRLQLLPKDGVTGNGGALSYVRPSNFQQDVTISNVDIRIPVMESAGAGGGAVTDPLPKPLPAGAELAGQFSAFGSAALTGVPAAAARATAKGRTIKLKLRCPLSVNLCLKSSVTIKGAKKKGPVGKTLIARKSAALTGTGKSLNLTLKLTAKARKALSDHRVKGRKKRVKGAKKLSAKITISTSGRKSVKNLSIVRTGRVR